MNSRQLLRKAVDALPLPTAVRQQLGRLEARYDLALELERNDIARRLSQDVAQWAPFVRFAPPGHFYSPIPRLDEIGRDAERIFDLDVVLPGIDVHADEQVRLVEQMAPLLADEPPAQDPTADRRYYADNPAFGIGDASVLYGMLRLHRPARIIEVGSGYSSAMILDVVERHLPTTEVTFIEPYGDLLRSVMRDGDESRCSILERRVQDVDADVFGALRANDVLFIDSTHVVRPGSDVCRLVLEVLPTLRPGVIVHLHDIFWPFQLPRPWVEEGRVWSETYLLRAYLCENPHWRIRLWTNYLALFHGSFMKDQLPRFMDNAGGSFWLQRV